MICNSAGFGSLLAFVRRNAAYMPLKFSCIAVQAMVDVEVSNNAALDTLQAWPADPGQFNDFFYYRYPEQVPIYTQSSYQGETVATHEMSLWIQT